MEAKINAELAAPVTLSDAEIEQRKWLLDFTDDDAARLAECRAYMSTRLADLAEAFYARQLAHPEIAAIIDAPDRLRRLKKTMRGYVDDLFSGRYDRAYVEHRLRIGEVHRAAGVAPKLYLAAVNQLQALLDRELEGFCCSNRAMAGYPVLQKAVAKLLCFDTQLVLDTYFGSMVGQIEAGKRRVESYAAELRDRNAALAEQSRRDSLTELFNRRGFREHLLREFANARRHRAPLSLVYIDLNDFKRVNDRDGHDVGDEVLVLVGKTISAAIRAGDIPCRHGGDEFCILLPRTDLAAARTLCMRLIEAFDAQPRRGVTFSVGVTQTGPDQFTDIDALVKRADSLMYRAKTRARKDHASHLEAG